MPRLRRIAFWSALAAWLGCGGDGGAGIELPALRVHTTTAGVEPDPDGYLVAVDGTPGRPIGVNASLEIGALEDGPHTVELREVAPNCSVQGTHPRTVQTTAGGTAEVEFEVECRPSTGAVRVITRTNGEDQDHDGYVVVVDGEARQIGLNASTTFEDVAAGERIAEILGVATNCSAATETYYQVDVLGGETVDVAFAFDCTPRQPDTGSLQVAVATNGPSDPDGYVVSVDGGVTMPIAPSATVLLTGLPVGARTVALSGIAANCDVSGANPRPVTVSGTELASVAFAVVCTQPPPSTGVLRLITATSGSDLDPTGYAVRVDGGTEQPVGANATIRIAGLSAGSHTISLEDVTPNCTVAENPRIASVPANGEVSVTFTVTCIPAWGTIATTAVTTGESIDPDGYIARVNGGAGKAIPANGTVTRGGLAPGSHTVQLDNVAPNCQVKGDNPRAVIVAGNETTPVTFEVICALTTGSLTVAVTGLPAGIAAQVTVTGPGSYSAGVNATTTLAGLAPGDYTIASSVVVVGGETYEPGAENQVVTVLAAGAPTVTVSYSTPGGAVNLRIAGLYVTQGSQTPDGAVPLVEGRDGYLRVFVVADGDNVATPMVRVRLYQSGSLVQTYQVAAPTGSTPTVTQEEPLGASWNVGIPGSWIQRGLAVLADVDPDEAIRESDESDNVFPLDATPATMAVRGSSVFAVRLVPIQLGNGGLIGDVSPGNLSRYLEVTQNLHPVPGIDATLHPVFTSSLGPAEAGDVNAALSNALNELRLLRIMEGSDRSYYGVTHSSYSSGGIAGLGYIGIPAALGWDSPNGAGGTAAHEFGHNWGRYHSPCGNPASTDPNYPYVRGTIGVYGFDLANERLIDPGMHDLMSYCHPRWVSDYTYSGVIRFRQDFQRGAAAARAQERAAEPSLIVWGRIEKGRPILEPAFLVNTRPSLPDKPGPYRLEGMSGAGGRLFSLAFEATPVADSPEHDEHFAFAIPLSPSAASDLSLLRLDGPAGAAEIRASAPVRAGPSLPAQALREGSRVQVRWDAASEPMAIVRDASTGEVVAIARGGRVDLATAATSLDLHLSDGLSSRRVTIPIGQ